jgi:hypothetical protein
VASPPAGRSLKIAQEYGERLANHGENFDPEHVAHLISHYPSHSFVIEREEAENLFESVRAPTLEEEELCTHLGRRGRLPITAASPIIEFLSVSKNAIKPPDVTTTSGQGGPTHATSDDGSDPTD